MNTEIYKDKYLKYKKKYISLKELNNKKNINIQQKGGYGFNSGITNGIDFNLHNIENEKYIGIDGKSNIIFDIYESLLDKLLIRDETTQIIDCDFIDNFNTKIFIDLDNKYGITYSDGNLNIPSSWAYKLIEGSKPIVTTNSSIFLLESKTDKTNRKVLKVFKGSDPNKSINYGTTSQDIDKYVDDYLSLQITKIFNTSSKFTNFQSKFITMDATTFNEAFNYNKLDLDKDFIQTNGEREICKLYLATGNNNPINDLIINLILQKLRKEKVLPYDNFVKYYNMFISKYNNEYTYFILMDYLDNTAYNLIEKNKTIDPIQILNTITLMCNTIKSKDYLFNHTDMKLENVFYKLFDTKPGDNILSFDITLDGNKKHIAYYLADFDKSSITYHNIRFYNNQSIIGTESSLYNSFLTNDMMPKNARISDKYILYNISRKSGISALTAIKNIETEQLYMRYSMFSYYTSFDYISLLLSMGCIISFDRLIELSTYADKFIVDAITVLQNYNKYSWTETKNKKYDGDFGLLLLPFISNNYRSKQEIKLIDSKPIIKFLYTTKEYNKLCLSIPFYVNKHEYQIQANKGLIKGIGSILATAIGSTNYIYKIDIDKTRKFYKDIDKLTQIEKYILDSTQGAYTINYTGDKILKSVFIVKTNKYSHVNSIYTYDDFSEEKEIVLDIYNHYMRPDILDLVEL